MPNNRQTARRVVSSQKANSKNRQDRSKMRTNIKSCLKAIDAKNTELARKLFIDIQKILDTLAKKNVIPKNRASRLKSRLNARIKAA